MVHSLPAPGLEGKVLQISLRNTTQSISLLEIHKAHSTSPTLKSCEVKDATDFAYPSSSQIYLESTPYSHVPSINIQQNNVQWNTFWGTLNHRLGFRGTKKKYSILFECQMTCSTPNPSRGAFSAVVGRSNSRRPCCIYLPLSPWPRAWGRVTMGLLPGKNGLPSLLPSFLPSLPPFFSAVAAVAPAANYSAWIYLLGSFKTFWTQTIKIIHYNS